MAVRIPHDNTLIRQVLACLPLFHLLCVAFSEKKGWSDSESIGGSLESLSSPGELTPAPACPFHGDLRHNDASLDFPSCLSPYPAHTARRLPKPASSLTISSDDLDDRDIASESGVLLALKGFFTGLLAEFTP